MLGYSHLKRRAATAMAVAALGVGGSIALAAPSQAAIGDCTSAALCFWADKNYVNTGSATGPGKVTGTNTSFAAFTHTTADCSSGTWDNCISSLYNKTSGTCFRLFMGYGAKVGTSGSYHTLKAGDVYSDLSLLADGSNDNISSDQAIATAGTCA